MDASVVTSLTDLPNLRLVVAPELAALPAELLATHIDRLYGEGAAESYEDYLEDIFGDIGRGFSSAVSTVSHAVGDVGRVTGHALQDVGQVAAQAAPVIAKVGGGALQGALSGSALGLPGIIGGAILGGTGAGLSAFSKGTGHDIGGVLSGVTNIAGQFTPLGRVGGALGTAISGLAGGDAKHAAGAAVNALSGLLGGGAGSALGTLSGGGNALGALTSLFGGGSATGQLMSLLERPETMQALAALNLGPAGRKSIPVGTPQTSIPVGAITNLIGMLAGRASAEAEAIAGDGEDRLEYMIGESGDYVGDPASPGDRAAAVWNVLNEAQAERVLSAVGQSSATTIARRQAEDFREWAPTEGVSDYEMEMIELAEATSEDPGEDLSEDLAEDYGEYISEDFVEWEQADERV
jgi:hypothetical protein